MSKLKILVIVCLTALTPLYVYYSNELKPYIGDAFFCVLTFLLYWFYLQKRINIWVLTSICCVILLFCSPAIFFVGGIFLMEFISAVQRRNKRMIIAVAIAGFGFVLFFASYYFLWLSDTAEFMAEWWANWKAGKSIVSRIINIFTSMEITSNSNYLWFAVPFAFIGMFSAFKQKNNFFNAITFSIILAIIASILGKWPLAGRLWTFLPVMVLLLAYYGYEFIRGKIQFNQSIIKYLLCAIIMLLWSNIIMKSIDKALPQGVINPLISYVQENIQEDEMLFVYSDIRPTFQYRNGYSNKIGTGEFDNIIWGKDVIQWTNDSIIKSHAKLASITYENCTDELQKILNHNKVYLLLAHYSEKIDFGLQYTGFGLQYLGQYGTITKVLEVHNASLYYFERKD